MRMREVKKFIDNLKKRENSDVVFNQYRHKRQRDNLRVYFNYIKDSSEILLLGEATGYNGCRHSGIPFTSGNILAKNKLYSDIRDRLSYKQIKHIKEYSAHIVYSFFSKYPSFFKKVLFFNAFPFHPHEKNQPESNRKPVKDELDEGKDYLISLFRVFNFKIFYPIGRVAERALKDLLEEGIIPNFKFFTIRHPSYGGANKFKKHMMTIFHLKDTSITDFF
jgi:uracil-DNA glycosylase